MGEESCSWWTLRDCSCSAWAGCQSRSPDTNYPNKDSACRIELHPFDLTLIVWCLQQFAIRYDASKGKYFIRLYRGEALETGLSLRNSPALLGVPVITAIPYLWDIEKEVGQHLYR
jgi:hypothetical protein